MIKTKYQWWGYAKSMIRRYPDKVTPDERAAVEAAIKETQQLRNSEMRMEIVESVLMRGSHTIEGAALKSYTSYATAKVYHADFIRSVGKHFSCRSLIPQ